MSSIDFGEIQTKNNGPSLSYHLPGFVWYELHTSPMNASYIAGEADLCGLKWDIKVVKGGSPRCPVNHDLSKCHLPLSV